jgi:hypothetical protein
MVLGMIQFEDEQALVTMKSKKVSPFVAKVGDFNFKGEHNEITLLKGPNTTDFPSDNDTFTTEIRNIKSVELFEE